MTSRHCRTASLLLSALLVASCSAFQVVPPSSLQMTQAIRTRPSLVALVMAEGNDADKTSTEESSTSTDIEVPKFDAQDFQEESSGPAFDWFTVVLGAYIVFAIADTAFKITPDKPYIQMLMEAITGSGGGEASS